MATLTPATVLAWRPADHPHSRAFELSRLSRTSANALNSSPSTSDSARRILAAAPWRHQLQQQNWRRGRGEGVVVRAGPVSTNVLIFAFVFPLSLIIGTVLVSIRISDRLDEKYLEELAMNKALMEEKEAEEDLDGENSRADEEEAVLPTGLKQNPVEVAGSAPRRRNRPRRQS